MPDRSRQATAYLRVKLFEKQGKRCCYCELPIYLKAHESAETFPIRSRNGIPDKRFVATMEHLRRKADGGTNRIDNLALACLVCNSGRGNTDWLTYKTLRTGGGLAA